MRFSCFGHCFAGFFFSMALVSRHLDGNRWGVRGEICCACTAGNKNAVHSIAVHSNDLLNFTLISILF